MRVLVMMGERRSERVNPVWVDATRIARQRGHEVVLAFAEGQSWRPRQLARRYDRFILKSRSPIWLNVAAGLAAYTQQIVNPYAATLRVLNKFETAHQLQAAGLPVPASWIIGSADAAAATPDDNSAPLGRRADASGRVVVKKVFGHRGQGVWIGPPAELGSALAQIDAREHFLQRFVSGREIKLKALGDQLGAFSRTPSTDIYVTGEPLAVTPELAQVATDVQKTLGLTMCGIDVIDSPAEGLQIIDVNLVPSYRQFPQWTEQLATLLCEPPQPVLNAHDS